ncbi:MAG: RtcB family protein [Spirochaetia bacterium]|jgi:tRNA-splicing ligase RtcB|nr:RtcB family protein [Spirochaetia bacterium]
MIVINTEKFPIKMWLNDIEDGALKQAKNIANLPFVYKWVAIMPDAHQGYGMPIGGVLAANGVVVPNAVGVDIGCGICAVRTNLKTIEEKTLKKIMGRIREVVPVGFKHHKENREWEGFESAPDIPIIRQELNSARKQLGTLGGGNHFIEIQKSNTSDIWIMVHSGSRNFGLKIANEYHKKALALCKRKAFELIDKDLSWLPIETTEAQEYLEAMNFALEFAKQNRFEIIDAIKKVFIEFIPETVFDETINIHHNYAAYENHFGKDVIVHRKGATSAKKDQPGIIPGSQGTKSYIVKGKGNPDSFMSCSHGAGRKMGRKQASRELNLKTEKKLLDEQGIIHSIRNVSDLDEAAGAYKDISEVMENQKDLVDIVFELSPLGVIKG